MVNHRTLRESNRKSNPCLQELIQRQDVWLGHRNWASRRRSLSSRHEELDKRLVNNGWPLQAFVELCQNGFQAEWQLLLPALLSSDGMMVLLNPPAQPFCQAFLQLGFNLDKMVCVSAKNKADFLQSITELFRSSMAHIVAWQPEEGLSYTELRKCALAAEHNHCLSVLIRPESTKQLSSPAALRVLTQLSSATLKLSILKQKGQLRAPSEVPVEIALPDIWRALPKHADLSPSRNQKNRLSSHLFPGKS